MSKGINYQETFRYYPYTIRKEFQEIINKTASALVKAVREGKLPEPAPLKLSDFEEKGFF